MKACIAVVLIFGCFGLSCDENDPTTLCSVEKPAEDLSWLAAEVKEMSESSMSHFLYVSTAKYGVMTVFLFRNCCPNCLTVVPVYDCSGKFLGHIGNGDDDISPELLNQDTVIWKPEDSACNFQ